MQRLFQRVNRCCRSYWILVCDAVDNKYRNLISDFLIWDKTRFSYETSILLVQPHEDKLSYLIDNRILSNFDNHPILLVGESPEMLPNITIKSQALTIMQRNNNFTDFLTLIHTQLRYSNIFSIRKHMESEEYWNWLNIQ